MPVLIIHILSENKQNDMKDLFDTLNGFDRKLSYNYETIAKEYLDQVKYYDEDKISNFLGVHYNANSSVTLASDSVSLEYVTKRSALIFEKALLSLDSNQFIETDGGAGGNIMLKTLSDVGNMEDFGMYIHDVSSLIKNNKLLFLPRRKHLIKYTGGDGTDGYLDNGTGIVDAIIKNKVVTEVNKNNIVKNKYIKPLFKIELPVVDNSDLKTFSDLIIDEHLHLDRLRMYLKERFIEIDSSKHSELFLTEVEKINLDIKKEVISLSSDYRNLRRKRAFQVSGSVITTVMATLLCINSEQFESLYKLMGASGGMYLFFEAFRDQKIEREAINSNPFYFIWLLENP